MLGLRTLNAILAVPATNLDSLRLYLSELIKDRRAIQNRPELTSAELANMADHVLFG